MIIAINHFVGLTLPQKRSNSRDDSPIDFVDQSRRHIHPSIVWTETKEEEITKSGKTRCTRQRLWGEDRRTKTKRKVMNGESRLRKRVYIIKCKLCRLWELVLNKKNLRVVSPSESSRDTCRSFCFFVLFFFFAKAIPYPIERRQSIWTRESISCGKILRLEIARFFFFFFFCFSF